MTQLSRLCGHRFFFVCSSHILFHPKLKNWMQIELQTNSYQPNCINNTDTKQNQKRKKRQEKKNWKCKTIFTCSCSDKLNRARNGFLHVDGDNDQQHSIGWHPRNEQKMKLFDKHTNNVVDKHAHTHTYTTTKRVVYAAIQIIQQSRFRWVHRNYQRIWNMERKDIQFK